MITPDTPVLLRDPVSGMICIKNICDITKKYIKVGNVNYGYTDFQCWTQKGWSSIKSVIKKHSTKKVLRVISPKGYIKTTEDAVFFKNCSLKPKASYETRYPSSYPMIESGMDKFHSGIVGKMLSDHSYTQVPDYVLNDKIENVFETLEDYKQDTIHSDICLAQLYYMYKKCNYLVKIEETENGITIKHTSVNENPIIVSVDTGVFFPNYLYSLETEFGYYQAGIGEFLVKT